MATIKSISAREILDARGVPTLEAKVTLSNGLSGVASVPSGSAEGQYEALDLRDGDMKRYKGKGVLKAVSKIKEIIAPALIGKKITEQEKIDKIIIELDGTTNKKNLGANSTLVVSMACARAAALDSKQELFVYLRQAFSFSEPKIPIPLFNIFNGGKNADTNLDFQEFLIIPKMNNISEIIRQGAEICYELGNVLRESGYSANTGSLGGYAPELDSTIEALEMIMAATVRAGYKPGEDTHLGIDVGSSLLYDKEKNRYIFPLEQSYFSSSNLLGLYDSWLKKYPIIYLEDGLADDDWASWRELTTELGKKIIIAGDELFATNINRLRQALEEKVANTIVIKPSQTGTLTETVECVKLAQKHGYRVVISHRSGETTDDFITDLAVACGADYLKAGSLNRGERLSKYNRLLAIADIIEQVW